MGATEAKYATKLEYLVCFAQDTEHLWLSWTFLKGSAMGTLISWLSEYGQDREIHLFYDINCKYSVNFKVCIDSSLPLEKNTRKI